jgi:hypothetical protein
MNLIPTAFIALATAATDCPQPAPFTAATDTATSVIQTVRQLPCPSVDETAIQEARTNYEKSFPASSTRITRKLDSLSLQGTNKEFEIINSVIGYPAPANWPTLAEGCDTVLCALTRLFNSEESAHRVLTLGARNGYIISGNGKQQWKPSEIREIDQAYAAVPEPLGNINHFISIHRIPDGYRDQNHSKNTAAYAQIEIQNWGNNRITGIGKISFYENTFLSHLPNRELWTKEASVHELCHQYDFSGYLAPSGRPISQQENIGFALLSWNEEDGKWVQQSDGKFVSDYAKTAPLEDFAESCMSCLLYPKRLKTSAPEKYQIIKEKIFNNQEFLETPLFSPPAWPPLDEKLKQTDFCKTTFTPCLKQYCISENGLFGELTTRTQSTMTIRFYKTMNELLNQSNCAKNSSENTAETLATELRKQPDFCEKGGTKRIKNTILNFCESTLSTLLQKNCTAL